MDAFDQFHPAVQHHVVNSLGWSSLRPLQEQAIQPLISRKHALLLAPTAGGKTEAAILPVFSLMLSEDWRGLSVVYLCPIKALLNDLEHRLRGYAALFGRSVGVWHGDIGASERKRLRDNPPDILLATPESLEVMLVSRLTDHNALFADLRVVVVDEIHAFAGDDRGWHLIALLGRLAGLSSQPIQRLGLSATVGDAESLLSWLVGGARGESEVIAPAAGEATAPDVTLDFVGSLDNAAIVISRLHDGEKRLVFCDSRRQVEQLAVTLRGHDVETYVSHSSLSQDERRRAEAAFSEARDCVIVATSTLELGIDVGDLDRMIQIDAPASVASFLQRLGRTGRRNGRRNALFLATSSAAFLKTLGLLHLWRSGFVEPVEPPAFPIHVLAQQILALVLQEGGVPRLEMRRWLQPFLEATAIEPHECDALIDHLLENGVLFEADGLVSLGDHGERLYGRKNFLELFSVFMAPPLFSVMEGRTEIGLVDDTSLIHPSDEPVYLTLAGRGWKVAHVDWSRRRVWVEPASKAGQVRWTGTGPGLSWELARAIPDAMINHQLHDVLSRRALDALKELQHEFDWVAPTGSVWIDTGGEQVWWTFAGAEANAVLAGHLRAVVPGRFNSDPLRIRPKNIAAEARHAALELLESAMESGLSAPLDDIEKRYKFTDLLAEEHQEKLALQRGCRLSPNQAVMLGPIAHVQGD